jgi:hypothetical protein
MASGVEDAPAGEAQQPERLLVTRCVACGGRTVGVRRLCDRGRQLRIACRDTEDVAAGGGEAPDRQLRGVDSRQGRGEPDRGLPVGELLPDADDLARLSTAVPETAIVEGEDGEPCVVESLREPVGARLLGHCEAAGHDHAGTVGSWIVPGGAFAVAAAESNLLPLH